VIIAALNRHKNFLRGELGRTITLKFTPDLRFIEDDSFAEAEKIETILKIRSGPRDLERSLSFLFFSLFPFSGFVVGFWGKRKGRIFVRDPRRNRFGFQDFGLDLFRLRPKDIIFDLKRRSGRNFQCCVRPSSPRREILVSGLECGDKSPARSCRRVVRQKTLPDAYRAMA